MAPEITERNRETAEDISLIAQAVHQISHDIHAMAADIRALRAAWDEHGAVVRGYQSGGLLGARAARKAASNGGA